VPLAAKKLISLRWHLQNFLRANKHVLWNQTKEDDDIWCNIWRSGMTIHGFSLVSENMFICTKKILKMPSKGNQFLRSQWHPLCTLSELSTVCSVCSVSSEKKCQIHNALYEKFGNTNFTYIPSIQISKYNAYSEYCTKLATQLLEGSGLLNEDAQKLRDKHSPPWSFADEFGH
jgi:hypothetical protein